MARQRLRLVQVRKPESFDDQKTPGDILANGESGADEQEQIEYVLSQIRQILGTPDWKDPVPVSLQEILDILAPSGVVQTYNEELTGLKNGVNVTFTTLQNFEAGTQRVYLNGNRLTPGVGSDYTIAESGGAGTGYDTVILDASLAPYSEESVLADYVVAG